ncbi:MAG: SUMF1/EgtB/PvdO family nonheme iron enzyme [Myxococcales bacterium]
MAPPRTLIAALETQRERLSDAMTRRRVAVLALALASAACGPLPSAGGSDAAEAEPDASFPGLDVGSSAAHDASTTLPIDAALAVPADASTPASLDAASAEPTDAEPFPVDAGTAADAALEPCALGNGSWQHPYCVPMLPASISGDTAASTVDVADHYAPCAPTTNESGPEIVYVLTVTERGTLTLAVDDASGDSIDVDVHLLTAADANACVARNNVTLSQVVDAGTYWIAVDSWFNGTQPLAGPFVLDLAFTPAPSSDCPAGMAPVGTATCMDLYEAPNVAGGLPLVMYSFNEGEAWCQARGKRLCFEDEWLDACQGSAGTKYPYGDTRKPGTCNDDQVWRQYDQTKLNGWPTAVNTPNVASFAELLAAARAVGTTTATTAADHVEWLYQAEGSGSHPGCVSDAAIPDLVGNVEEWARRRNATDPSFHGNLKGRYWADTRTCQDNIYVHGDTFHFYEIGFRCCQDRQ